MTKISPKKTKKNPNKLVSIRYSDQKIFIVPGWSLIQTTIYDKIKAVKKNLKTLIKIFT